MPRIPRRSEGGEERNELASGDPLAPPTSASQGAATSGDPLTQVTPPESADKTEPSDAATTAESSQGAESSQTADAAEPSQTTPADGSSPTSTPAEGSAAGAVSVGEQPTQATAPVEPQTAVHTAPGDAQPTGDTGEVSAQTGEQAPVDARPGFRHRTRMRRRLRYLRRLRELAFRDLGGLVFDLHRFGRERSDLVTAKLEALANIDRELRTLQDALGERRDFTDLREAGIAACPRCGTLHDTDANYCPGCGSTLRSVLVREAFPVSVTPAGETEQQPQPHPQPQPESQQSTPAS